MTPTSRKQSVPNSFGLPTRFVAKLDPAVQDSLS